VTSLRSEIPPGLRAELDKAFEFERPIGSGGMGIVWLARDRLLDRRVAIKFLRTEVIGDAGSAHRFLVEARIAARLQHPGIVALLTFGEHEGTRYLVMPYVDGESLAARVARGPLSEREARRIVAALADALDHVHGMGIVHRDIKPANVLLERPSNQPRLTDFGIARSAEGGGLTATGLIVGTPAYLAPEQISGDGRPVDGRADIYALGVVAYELVCGRPPFEGGTSHETIARHLTEPAPSPRTAAPGVSEAYANAVLRCLEKDRDRRFPTAGEFARALRESTEGEVDPPALRPVRSALANGLIFSGFLLTWGPIGLSAFWPDDASFMMRLAVIALVAGVPLMTALSRVNESFGGERPSRQGLRDSVRAALRVPDWWAPWWPRRWRSPLERMQALPGPLRSAARWWGAFMGFALLHIGVQGALISSVAALQPPEFAAFRSSVWWDLLAGAMVGGPFIIAGCGLAFAVSAWRARGLLSAADRKHASRWLKLPRATSTWTDPVLLSLLERGAESEERVPATFEALAEEITSLHARLQRAGWRLDDVEPLLQEARAARAEWVREAEELRRDADPAEAERLRARVSAIDAVATPSREQDELRDLLRKQLSLHERQRERLREREARLDRLHAAITLLWRQLRALRADDVALRDSGEVTGRLRLVIEDVARLRDGAQRLTAPVTDGSNVRGSSSPSSHTE
jgi:tRNA A-37 threonylcarbamoyl transferase component Bud32